MGKRAFFQKGSFWETIGDYQFFPKNFNYEISNNGTILTEIEVYKVNA